MRWAQETAQLGGEEQKGGGVQGEGRVVGRGEGKSPPGRGSSRCPGAEVPGWA